MSPISPDLLESSLSFASFHAELLWFCPSSVLHFLPPEYDVWSFRNGEKNAEETKPTREAEAQPHDLAPSKFPPRAR